jgi:hypothetical protein
LGILDVSEMRIVSLFRTLILLTVLLSYSIPTTLFIRTKSPSSKSCFWISLIFPSFSLVISLIIISYEDSPFLSVTMNSSPQSLIILEKTPSTDDAMSFI